MDKFRIIGDIASELLAEIRGKKVEKRIALVRATKVVDIQEHLDTGQSLSIVRRSPDTVEALSASIKEAFAPKHRPQGRSNGR